MLDIVLNWFVIAIPFLVTVGAVVLGPRFPQQSHYRKVLWGGVILGLGFSGLAYWQQARASASQRYAIEQTSKTVAKETTDNVTSALGREYKELVESLTAQNRALTAQLTAQGKDVTVIKRSDFVTGKKAVKVEVINQGTSQLPQIQDLKVVAIREISSPHADAPFGIELTIQTNVSLQSIVLNIECADLVSYVSFSPSANFSGVVAGNAMPAKQNPHVAIVSMETPAFTPEHAMIVQIFSKSKNHVTGLKYQARNS